MPANYGKSRVGIEHFTVGAVHVVSAVADSALFPRIRLHVAWTLGHLRRDGARGREVEYRLIDYGGELLVGRNGPVVATLSRPGRRLPIRSLPYVQPQHDALIADLDGSRFERLEELRQGGPLELTLHLWPEIEVDGVTADARIDELHLTVPREDWLTIVQSVSGDRIDLLEQRYRLSHAIAYQPSLKELERARSSIVAGDYDSAVLLARKAVSLVEDSVRNAAGQDLSDELEERLDDRHAKLYAGLVKRAKDMGNIKAHRAAAREYTRAEAQFAVRFATILIEVLGAIVAEI